MDTSFSSMKMVIVFRSDLLHHSETFIKEQVIALTKWTPVLVGYRKVEHGLDLTGIDVRILPGLGTGRWRRLRLRLCQWLGIAHAPTVRALRAIGANLIHIHFSTDAVTVWPSIRRLGLPMLVTLHGYDINIYREWWEAGHGGLLMRTYPRRLLRMAKAPGVCFLAVSKAIAERAVQYGIPEDKITVAYVGIDTKRFKPSGLPLENRRKRILFIGRMVEKKAPLLMIRAYAEVRKVIPAAELVMIGDGPLLGDAKRMPDTLAVSVGFLGACNSDEVLAQLHKARVCCLPSVIAANGDAEGFGLVLLEAQGCGVPVISSAMGGANEGLLDGITGLKFETSNVELLVKHIISLVDDSEKAARMSVAASAFAAKHFDIAQLYGTLEEIYSNVSGDVAHK